jgi:WD40 repeat protein
MVLTIGFLAFFPGYGLVRATEKTSLDAYGDPLPKGATARFGSLRWRMPCAIKEVAISANGKLVAAVNMYGKVFVWERRNGRLLHEISGSKTGEKCVSFSPDGKYLATGGRYDSSTGKGDFRVRIWDLKTGKLKVQLLAQQGYVSKLVFTADSSTLLSAGFSQPVIAWKIPSGEKLREFPTEEYTHHAVALSPNGELLAISDNDLKTVSVVTFDGTRKMCRLESKWNYFHSFEFTPGSKSLLTHEHDRLRFWEVATGKPQLTIALKHDTFRRAHLAPDGKKIALTNLKDQNDIHWLEAVTGKPLDPWKGSANGVYKGLSALAFSPDGASVVTGEWGAVRVWNTATRKVVQEPKGPTAICYSLIFSGEGKTLLAASHDCFYFLDGRTLQERARVPLDMFRHEYPNYRYSVALSPDGNLAAFLGAKDEIILADSRKPKTLRTLRRPDWLPASIAFSPDGKHLYASGYRSPGLRVWNLETEKEISPFDADLKARSNLSVARRARKLAIVVSGDKDHCRLWDLKTGKEEPSLDLTASSVRHSPDDILLSPDGKLLAAAYVNSHVSVWDVARKIERHRFNFGFDGPGGWTFSVDGTLLITGHDQGCFRTWDMASGKKVTEVHGHPAQSLVLACSPDGEGLVSSCTSCTVLRWQRSAWTGK